MLQYTLLMDNGTSMTPIEQSIQQQMAHFWQLFVAAFELHAPSSQWQTNDRYELVERINTFKLETVAEEWMEGIMFEVLEHPERLQLVLSADGHQEAFPYVRLLQVTAPQTPYLEVLAFRSPLSSPEFEFKMHDVQIHTADLKPQVLINNGFIDLRLGFPADMTEDNIEQYQQIAYILVDHILGEWDSMTKVASIEACGISDLDPAEGTIYAITELHAAILNIWEQDLGFLGIYPTEDMRYAVGEARSHEAGEEEEPDIMINLNQSAAVLVGHPDYMQSITVEASLEHFKVLVNLEDRLMDSWLSESTETLSDKQGGIFAYRLSFLREGTSTQCFYVRSTERTLAYIHAYLEHHLGAEHGCIVECTADPAWMNYRMVA